MAANPLAVNLAASSGINITWGGWALAAIVPGLICLISVPLILYALYPPEVKDTPDAPAAAQKELAKLGPMSLNEKITAGVRYLCVGHMALFNLISCIFIFHVSMVCVLDLVLHVSMVCVLDLLLHISMVCVFYLVGAFAVTVGLWIFGSSIGVNAVAAATVGLTILLVTNVITWKVRGLQGIHIQSDCIHSA
jgi:di/tricarboxylate transporter